MNELFETDELLQLDAMVKRFAKQEVVQTIDLEGIEHDSSPPPSSTSSARARKTVDQVLADAAELGLLCAPLSEELGGLGLDPLGQVLILQRFAEQSAGVAARLATHYAALRVLELRCDQPGVRAHIDSVTAFEGRGAAPLLGLAFPEPVCAIAGDPFEVHTDENGDITLLGSLVRMSADAPRIVLVFRPQPAEDGSAGSIACVFDSSSVDTAASKPSHMGTGLQELPRDRWQISTTVNRGDAFSLTGDETRAPLGLLKLLLSAVMVGTARGAFDAALQYTHDRFQTGRPIIEHQQVRRMLARMRMLIEAAVSLVYRAAAATQRGEELYPLTYDFCGEALEEVCLDAIQLHGGYGYMREYGVEGRLRDIKGLQALCGSYTLDLLAI